MKITDIDYFKIHPKLAERYSDRKVSLNDIDNLAVARIKTNNGIVGYGEIRVRGYWTPPPDHEIEPLIGQSPFDIFHNDLQPELGGALYDVMGKHLGVPAYKLMGQKQRDVVTVAAWTRPAPPETFREEIKSAVSDGYNIFKMHTSPYYDVIEQTRLAEEVAPENFRIHYDFNGQGRTLGEVAPLIERLAKDHPIVGWIEDPLPRTDVNGWQTLRKKSRIPIIHGGGPVLGGFQEVMLGFADIYMIGGFSIPKILELGSAYSLSNVQTIFQHTGNTLTKALALHIACVLPTATGHSINLDDQYSEDITTKTIPVTEGFSPVPENPGLGFEVDEAALNKLAGQNPIEVPKHLGVLCLPGGHKIYTPSLEGTQRFTGREEGALRGFNTQIWEDDGSSEFDRIYEFVQNEGKFEYKPNL